MNPPVKVDRAALVRRALVELVAEGGFHGAAMAAVAERAGVATGTAYVHYASKDELVLAAYREVKAELGAVAACAGGSEPRARFMAVWRAIFEHCAADPVQARFLVQVDASPYAAAAHDDVMSDPDNELARFAAAEDMRALLVHLPPEVLYDIGLGPAVRLAARQDGPVRPADLDTMAAACWRAVTKP